jgi:hypothetical protein
MQANILYPTIILDKSMTDLAGPHQDEKHIHPSIHPSINFGYCHSSQWLHACSSSTQQPHVNIISYTVPTVYKTVFNNTFINIRLVGIKIVLMEAYNVQCISSPYLLFFTLLYIYNIIYTYIYIYIYNIQNIIGKESKVI